MNIAICNIIEQDEIRGFYSLNKSKTTDFKLLTFCGKANGNFVNLKADINDEGVAVDHYLGSRADAIKHINGTILLL